MEIGAEIGRKLKGGEVIELISDLGGGKTAFVRGLAKGMDSMDVVSSPSFTISNRYHGKDITLYHYDFYRLAEPGVMKDEITEALQDLKGVVVVEWASIVKNVLPLNRLSVTITINGENSRLFNMECPEELSYLLPANP